ncbi:MAG: DUF420 domain-containing protein [Candidatus Omnitrophica bacterium]|nr:DUF420 domain-containing protein [Candidatus Omnitrophota bacterium]
MDLSIFPTLNASLNALSAAFLILGYRFIRQGKREAHRMSMISACTTSLLFLISYLYYHYHHGSTRYQGQGLIRSAYFTILISHTVLAVAVFPFILRILYLAFRGRFEKHAKMARFVFPVWLYVAVTGVVIYWMLYRM